MWVGLDVADDAAYAAYRAEITPLLESHGGGLRLDFVVARTLKSDVPHAINRVFAIGFPDAAARDRFFADPAYRRAKDAHFTRAVRHVAILAELQRS